LLSQADGKHTADKGEEQNSGCARGVGLRNQMKLLLRGNSTPHLIGADRVHQGLVRKLLPIFFSSHSERHIPFQARGDETETVIGQDEKMEDYETY
jgi:hypothetical protein